jgi:hypothetical protein
LQENQGRAQYRKFEIKSIMLRDLKRGGHQGKRNQSAKDGGAFKHQAVGHLDRAPSNLWFD